MQPGIPLLGHRSPDAIVAYRGGEPVPVRRFLGDVQALAARLPAGGHLINLCADRYLFAVGLGAALCRGAVTLLPQSLAPEPLQRLSQAYLGARALVEPGAAFDGLPDPIIAHLAASPPRDEVPQIDPSQLAVVAFTSGSTGLAQPQPKTWGSVAQSATAEAKALGIVPHAALTLVGTVPPQHMYGLESTVLLAMRNGIALHAARPLYPADVRAALAQVPDGRILVTTPVHLRALLADDVALPALELVVCATAPLPPALAHDVESRYAAPLREIYGFTEAGQVASRRTATQTHWRTLPGVSVRTRDGQAWFGGGHVQREVATSDILDVLDAQTFALHGRSEDMINVAGKRTSLAHLNHTLACVDGVLDCAFLMPEEADPGIVTRPMAFAVAPGRTREQLLAALRKQLDPVFLPRPLQLVEALPRNATGKLTREALLELAHAPSPAAEEESVLVQPDDPVARGHFPGDAIVPGALILDEVVRQAQRRVDPPCAGWDVLSAKFLAPLRPGEAVRVELEPATGGGLRFACYSGARNVASGVVKPHRDPA